MAIGETGIHPTAVVSPEADLHPTVSVGPHAVIGERVSIGEGSVIGPGMLIEGPTRIGCNNRFYGKSSIGTDPQDLKFRGEESFLEIGDDNLIREFVTINRGTEGGGSWTRLGSGNLLMTGVHVAHDCLVGSGVILANAATLAGHIKVEDGATVGAFSGVHQFCRVGRHAFIGGYSVLTRDVLPFIKTVGVRNEATTYGVNGIGLERKGFPEEVVEALKRAYRILFHKGLKLKEAVSRVREETNPVEVEELLAFVESAERGFVR